MHVQVGTCIGKLYCSDIDIISGGLDENAVLFYVQQHDSKSINFFGISAEIEQLDLCDLNLKIRSRSPIYQSTPQLVKFEYVCQMMHFIFMNGTGFRNHIVCI